MGFNPDCSTMQHGKQPLSVGAHNCSRPAHFAKSFWITFPWLPSCCLQSADAQGAAIPAAGGVPELMWVLNQGSTPALSAAAALERLVTTPSGKHCEAVWLSAVERHPA